MKVIVTIVGARPQFIKTAPVSRAISERDDIREILVHTGQHFDANMSDIFFDELGISKPSYSLDISGGGHGEMTGKMMIQLEPLLVKLRPDIALVYGDTNSTLAGALTATKLQIPVAHVEAGLRSFNRSMPEEINRIMSDHVSDLLFVSTDVATSNLSREGIPKEKIHQVGDVMYDAALIFAKAAGARVHLLSTLGLEAGRYVLCTLHRADNTDDPARLSTLVNSLEKVSKEIPVVLPLHPRTRAAMARNGLSFKNVKTVEPLGYLDMIALETQAGIIATDSGGVQKEAFFYEVPCVTLRDETEWTELVDLGWNKLVSPASGRVAEEMLAAFGRKGQKAYPYGDGEAARAIAKVLAA